MRLPRLLAGAGLALVVAAQPAPASAQAKPQFTAPVVDAAKAVPDEVEARLGAALEDYRRRSGNQVAAAIVRTTGRESVEDYAEDLFDEWAVGTKGQDNGVLLVVAVEDRRVRIEVGYGVEDELTDLEAGRIVNDRIVPLLRAGDLSGAVEQGTGAIRQALGDAAVGALPPVPEADPDGDGGGSRGVGLFPLLLLGFGIMSFMGRRGRRGWGGGVPIIWGGGGWGGGGFGGGGGGFGGGGGGGSGGGGASGSW